MNKIDRIQCLNLEDFLSKDPNRKSEFVKQLGNALENIGFFALSGHGVDQAVLDNTYNSANSFFDLTDEVKKNYEVKGLGGQRGFTSFGKEHAKNQNLPDLKEFFHLGQLNPSILHPHQKFVPNVWPKEVPSFQVDAEQAYKQLMLCGFHLLDACSLYIGEEEHFLRNLAVDGNTVLRIINYPPLPKDSEPVGVRAAAHEDINLITLLCEATAPGLELLNKDGSWLPVQAIKGQIIVDSGDMLQNLTNGLIKSTTHRVVNPEKSRDRRFSMPLFVHPRSDVSLSPLENCVKKTGGLSLFPDISAGDYLSKRLKEIGLKG